MAKLVTARNAEGEPTLNTFAFNEEVMYNGDLKIKIFDSYCEEWARFVLLNRQNQTDTQAHDFDIVYGPIADDRVGYQINNLLKGLRTMDEFIDALKYIRPTFQYFFGTERAIKHLTKV